MEAGESFIDNLGGAAVIPPAPGGAVEEAAREAHAGLGPDLSDGAYRVIVGAIPAGDDGPPLHLHPDTDEAFYVAEGELTVVVPEDEVVATPGTFVFIPRGTVHTARNSGSGPMRGLILISPGDAEHIFESPDGQV
jgi:mannose-6-phosphate isomerase-like protein (cupin superfamily)